MSEFGLTVKKDVFDKYIKKYIIIYPISGNTNFSGKYIGIRDGFAVLNPHQSGVCTKDGILVRKLIKKESLVNIFNISGIEPTTKESLKNYCDYLNKKEESNHTIK